MKFILTSIYLVMLIYASYVDIKSRVIPNWIHILILCISLINLMLNLNMISLLNSALGCIVAFIVFILPNFIKDWTIGGGDIKLISSSGLFLGLESIIIASLLGLFIAIVVEVIKALILNKRLNSLKFALVPYLSIGCFFSIMISYL